MTMAAAPPTSVADRIRERFRSLTVPGVGLALATPAALFAVAGPRGAAVGLFGAAIWLLAPVYAFLVAQAGLLAVAPESLAITDLLALQGAVALLLLAELVTERVHAVTVLGFLALLAVLGGGATAAVAAAVEPWVVAVALLAGVGLLAYGLHRVELVALGLVPEGP